MGFSGNEFSSFLRKLSKALTIQEHFQTDSYLMFHFFKDSERLSIFTVRPALMPVQKLRPYR